MISDRTANAIIVVVTCVWVANIAASMLPFLDHDPSEAVNGAFMLIVGGAFALRARSKSNGDSG